MPASILSLVCVNAYRLFAASIGAQAPAVHAIYDKMKDPLPGDLVIEQSTIYDRSRDEHRFGKLIAAGKEKLKDEDGEEYSETCWYIEHPNGRLYRWHNAGFLKVLEDLEAGEMWANPPSTQSLFPLPPEGPTMQHYDARRKELWKRRGVGLAQARERWLAEKELPPPP